MRQTVPGHWTGDGETSRPIADQVSPWNDESYLTDTFSARFNLYTLTVEFFYLRRGGYVFISVSQFVC